MANPDSASTAEDTPVSGNLLGNDSDADGDALAITGFSVGGTAYAPGQTATLDGVGTITVGANGAYSFTPAANTNSESSAL